MKYNPSSATSIILAVLTKKFHKPKPKDKKKSLDLEPSFDAAAPEFEQLSKIWNDQFQPDDKDKPAEARNKKRQREVLPQGLALLKPLDRDLTPEEEAQRKQFELGIVTEFSDVNSDVVFRELSGLFQENVYMKNAERPIYDKVMAAGATVAKYLKAQPA